MQTNCHQPKQNHSAAGLVMMTNRTQQQSDEEAMPLAMQLLVEEVEKLVLDGNQNGIATFFADWPVPPTRVGDWELRVNVRRLDGVPTSRTIHALPLTLRAREIFEAGAVKRLTNLGYTPEEARTYLKLAFRKKYVWVESVLEAVKEMMNSFQGVTELNSYELAGDPRRLASTIGIPANPYKTTHSHFLVAIEMARLMIDARIRSKERKDQKLIAASEVGAPESNPIMVAL